MSFKRNGIRLALAIVLGRTQAATAQTAETPRFELGPEITQTYFPQNSVGVDYQAALGASFSANVNQHFGADGVVTFTPAATGTATNRAGGRLLQISAGVRAGFSKDRFRIYGKLRPGAVSFGSVITRIGPPPTSQFFRGRLTEPMVDIGGIAEYDIAKRLALRYEAGDMIIHYGARSVIFGEPPTPARVVHSFQFGIGFMFLFH